MIIMESQSVRDNLWNISDVQFGVIRSYPYAWKMAP